MQQTTSGTEPVSASKRIELVDALRAFALLGIIITHATIGFLVGAVPAPDFMKFNEVDEVLSRLVPVFIEGKFFAIFSFLFGLSFAIQLANASRRGAPFTGRFAWRLTILFVMGFVHSLLFAGDILMIYALLGFLLLPIQRVRTRTLAIIAMVLILNLPGLILGSVAVSMAPPADQAQTQQREQAEASFREQAKREYDIKRSGTVGELVQLNLTASVLSRISFLIFTGRLWIIYGLFLLGVCAGRLSLFTESDQSRRTWRRILTIGGVGALATTTATLIYPFTFDFSGAGLAKYYIGTVQHCLLAAVYVAGLTLLAWRSKSQTLVRAFAPMGRMGLTTYLLQSAFGLIVFYGIGFGLLGQLSVTSSIAISVLFFFVQALVARWWLAHFQMGPAEWLWRSLTDFSFRSNVRRELPQPTS